MPNPIKAFFEKKKSDAKFKLAGKGQKLGDAAAAENAALARRQAAANQSQTAAAAGPRPGPSGAQMNAAQAALARFDNAKEDDFDKKRSQAIIRAQVQRQIEQEKKTQEEIEKLKVTYGEKPVVQLDAPSACSGVFFHCELIGPDVLPKDEMKAKIKEFLFEQAQGEEKGLTACLIIHTLAKNQDAAKTCIDTLCKYLDNILLNPTEEKYRKIRKSNKAYQERVAPVEGVNLFLEACGFETQVIEDQEFWVFPPDRVNDEQLEAMSTFKDALQSSEAITAELDRNVHVLYPSQASQKFSLPPDFFSHNAEEIRKAQQARAEVAEREGMLRTKAMREKEEQREKRKYRYSLIRVRFPDGIVLQGTFSVYDRYRSVHDFVAESLKTPLPFVLYETSTRLEQSDYDSMLVDLKLAPSALLTFSWHPDVAAEIQSQMEKGAAYLKEDLMALTAPL